MAFLGVVLVALALLSGVGWSLAAGAARGWLERSPGRLAGVAGASGVAMIGLGVQLAVTGRKD